MNRQKLKMTYMYLLKGNIDLYSKSYSPEGPSSNAYIYPVSDQIKEIFEMVEKTPEYCYQYSEVIAEDLLNDLESDYWAIFEFE